ncbi:MAG TPA: DUF1080 domain-containing protein [Blastocatellia bacterium]|nr:DUF1080 domain-containing protein [Blastocatellia bacterium]
MLLRRVHAGVAVILFTAGSFFAGQESLSYRSRSETGWRQLFDGKSLKGWAATGNNEGWAVEDGAIACLVKGGDYLYTTEEFENFTLSAEFKVASGTNSGIFVRWSDLKDPVNTGIEVQVLDSYGKPADKHACGAIYDIIAPARQTCKPAGEWNKVLITCNRSLVAVELNDQKIAQMDLDQWTAAGMNPDGTRNKFTRAYKDLPRKGHIGLRSRRPRLVP